MVNRTTTDNAANGLRAMRICLAGKIGAIDTNKDDLNSEDGSDNDLCSDDETENLDEEMYFLEHGPTTEQDELDAMNVNAGHSFEGLLHVPEPGQSVEKTALVQEAFSRLGHHLQISCFCHSLHLMVGDGLKCLGEKIKEILQKCHSLARLDSQSPKFREIIKSSIPTPVKTRWGYELRMIDAIIDIGKDTLWKAVLACKVKTEERKLYLLSANEFHYLNCLSDILEPIATISDRAQAKETTIEIVCV